MWLALIGLAVVVVLLVLGRPPSLARWLLDTAVVLVDGTADLLMLHGDQPSRATALGPIIPLTTDLGAQIVLARGGSLPTELRGQSPEEQALLVWRVRRDLMERFVHDFERVDEGLYAARMTPEVAVPAPLWLFCFSKLRALPFRGRPVAAVVSQHLVLVADGASDAALEALATRANAATQEGTDTERLANVPRALVELEGDEWRDFTPAPGRAVPLLWELRSAIRLRNAVVAQMVPGLELPVGPVFSLAEGDHQTIASVWVGGVPQLLLRGDVLVLLDPDLEGPARRTDVPCELLIEELGWMLEPLAEGLLLRPRGPAFPSPNQRAFLRRRADALSLAKPAPTLPALTEADVRAAAKEPGGVLFTAAGARVPDGRELAMDLALVRTLARAQSGRDLLHVELCVAERGLTAGGAEPAEADLDQAVVRLADALGDSVQLEAPVTVAGGAHALSLEVGRPAPARGDQAYTWPFPGGLELRLVSTKHQDDSVTLRPVGEAEAGGVARERLWRLALANLEARSLEPREADEPGVYDCDWEDALAASRLALPELAQGLRVSGHPVAFTPTADAFVVAGSEDPAALAKALERAEARLAEAEPEDLLTGQPWILKDGHWAPWQPEPGHPLLPGLEALAQRMKARPAA